MFFGFEPVPCSIVNLCRYVVFLARSLSYSSIICYLNILRLIHLESGFRNPLEDFRVKSILRGIKRTIGAPVKRKLPITGDILLDMYKKLDLSSSFHATFWAAAIVAFFSFLRKSSILPKNAASFNRNYQLCCSSVTFTDFGALLLVQHTKTIQCRDRVLRIPLPMIQGSPLCPVNALKTMFAMLSLESSEYAKLPLFSYTCGGKVKILTHNTFVSSLRAVLTSCGYNDSDYSGHSFRRGGACHAFNCNIPVPLIKHHGDWKSNAYLRYIEVSSTTHKNMMSVFADGLPK